MASTDGESGRGEVKSPEGPTAYPSSSSPTSRRESRQLPYHAYGKYATYFVVVIVSVSAMLSSLSSNVFFPAQRDIARGLNVSPYIVNFAITTYLVCQGIAPSFWSPLADLYGRRVVLMTTLTVYVGANVGLALTPNAAALLVFRALQSAGCASTISLGAGVIADIAGPSTRGGYLGLFSGLRQFGLAVGPVVGGVLSGYLGWRSIFWFLVILSTICLVLIVTTVPETLRRISGLGLNVPRKLTTWPLLGFVLPYMKPNYVDTQFEAEVAEWMKEESHSMTAPRKAFSFAIFIQPFSMLIEPDVACALFFGAACYTAWSMMIATTTVLLVHNYSFTTVQTGLCFLANGIGCVLGSILSGRGLNADFEREVGIWNYSKARTPRSPIPRPIPLDFPLEKARLGTAPQYSAVMVIGFLIFGWSLTPPGLHRNGGTSAGHWITPLLAQFLVGFSNTAVLNCNNTLVVDLFPGKSASASAVINLSRNLTAAVGVALVDYIEDALNPGWLGVILAAIVVLGLAPLWLHSMRGPGWRTSREMKLRRAAMPD